MPNHKIFYISDMHFCDKGVFFWDIRNDRNLEVFASPEEKDEVLIERWNARVSPRDHVYMLGDSFSCSKEKAQEILRQLHGAKHIIRGNHDRAWVNELAQEKKFNVLDCAEYAKISDAGRKVILSHYPIAFWDGQHEGAYHVYGHLHNSRENDEFRRFGQCLVANKYLPEFRAINAGAMLLGYEPKTLDELIVLNELKGIPKYEFQEQNYELAKWKQEMLGDKNPNAHILNYHINL